MRTSCHAHCIPPAVTRRLLWEIDTATHLPRPVHIPVLASTLLITRPYQFPAIHPQVAWALNVTELVWPGGAGATNAVQTRTSPTDDGAGNIIIGTQTIVPPGNPKGVQGYVVSEGRRGLFRQLVHSSCYAKFAKPWPMGSKWGQRGRCQLGRN